MKLARLAIDGAEVVAVVAGDTATPVAEGGQAALVEIASSRERPEVIGAPVPLSSTRILSPIPRPPSIRDYMAFEAHARDSRPDRTVDPGWYEHPLFYFSNPSVLRNPADLIVPPTGSRCLDYELEVACVIGHDVANLDPEDPGTLDAICGFTIFNDWSARDVQTHEMKQNLGPTKSKDFASSIGPFVVTPDELPGFASGRPTGRMQARVNGATWSEGELGDIHFSWAEMVGYASRDEGIGVLSNSVGARPA